MSESLEQENERLRKENDRLKKLYRLAAEDYIFFSTWSEECKTWLDSPHYTPVVFLNDTFAPAADGELLTDDQLDLLIACANRFGQQGVIAWAAHRRGVEPMETERPEEYYEARKFILDFLLEK
jgi:hypothetical protein